MKPNHVAFLLCTAIAAGCGARASLRIDETSSAAASSGSGGAPAVPDPEALYLPDDQGCGAEQTPANAAALLTPSGSGQGVAVVEVFYQSECTGVGGDYLVAHEVDGFREFWLGAHACFFLPQPPPSNLPYGVLRYNITAAFFQVSPDVCIGIPGQPPGLGTGDKTEAVALFTTLADARQFAASLPAAE